MSLSVATASRAGTWAAILSVALVLLTVPSLSFAQDPADPNDAPSQDAPAQGESNPTGSPQQPAKVTVSLSPEQITVGGLVTAELTLVWMGRKPSEPARFPTWQETWGSAEVLEASEPVAFEDQSGRHIFKQILRLTSFEVGDVKLPKATIALPLGDETLELQSEGGTSFEVVSVLPDPPAEGDPGPADPRAQPGQAPPGSQGGQALPGDQGGEGAGQALEPRPPAPPLELAHARRAFIVTASVLTGLVLLSLYLMLRRLAAQSPAEHLPFQRQIDPLTLLSPLEELMSRLDRVDPDYVKPAHTGLSLALRRYLGRRLAFPAVESTTTEIQERLRPLMLPADMGMRTVQLLRDCDMVKFAGISVTEDTTRERVRLTRELGQRLEERFRPAPEADEGSSDAGTAPSTGFQEARS